MRASFLYPVSVVRTDLPRLRRPGELSRSSPPGKMLAPDPTTVQRHTVRRLSVVQLAILALPLA
ncbi:MAG TPA: hypothetical protein VMM18_00390 [Gemmatimonadaceae bacterium]|nr:hypothetical protein [Gemmatimonadaceae bacterium]